MIDKEAIKQDKSKSRGYSAWDLSPISQLLTICYKELRDYVKKVLIGQPVKPYMKHKEIAIILELIERKKPKYCLEYGAGYSTCYFPKYLNEGALWISIEHDEYWANVIKRMIGANTKVYHIPPNNYPWTDEHNDGSYTDLRDYVEFPRSLGMRFDFILVDGRARKDCLICALDLLNIGGIIVLHDANRKYYLDPCKLYRYQVLFTDHRKDAGGLWIGSRDLDINTVLDVKKHREIWQKLAQLERWLKI
jgi:predicted O-methyltransferase YrrM